MFIFSSAYKKRAAKDKKTFLWRPDLRGLLSCVADDNKKTAEDYLSGGSIRSLVSAITKGGGYDRDKKIPPKMSSLAARQAWHVAFSLAALRPRISPGLL
jgi:hypothetical protein